MKIKWKKMQLRIERFWWRVNRNSCYIIVCACSHSHWCDAIESEYNVFFFCSLSRFRIFHINQWDSVWIVRLCWIAESHMLFQWQLVAIAFISVRFTSLCYGWKSILCLISFFFILKYISFFEFALYLLLHFVHLLFIA